MRVVKVIEYFDISGWGPLALLLHHEKGLQTGTLLKRPEHDLQWKVKSRVMPMHSASRQKIFENETVEYLHLNIKNPDAFEKNLSEILEMEAQGIYQYIVEPTPGRKPMIKGDELLIILP